LAVDVALHIDLPAVYDQADEFELNFGVTVDAPTFLNLHHAHVRLGAPRDHDPVADQHRGIYDARELVTGVTVIRVHAVRQAHGNHGARGQSHQLVLTYHFRVR
jgi:hypothetical protein